ncbi:MAG: MobQ family relaxase [Geminicoccaceae bacterium]
MAVYHCSVSIISRGDGRSAVAAAAIRAAETLRDERNGRRCRSPATNPAPIHAEILAPTHAPAWMRDRERLWNAVEAAEKRKDSQLARQITLSLPRELDHRQQIELVRGFAHEQLVACGMVVDLTVRETIARDGRRQRAAVLMATTRQIDPTMPSGFAPAKERAWNGKAALYAWRKAWAAHLNTALAAAGSDARVDHRSLEAQRQEALQRGDHAQARGLDRLPQPKLGRHADELERRGIATERGDLLRDTEEYNQLTQQLYELHDQIEMLQAARHAEEPDTPDLTSDGRSIDRPLHAP